MDYVEIIAMFFVSPTFIWVWCGFIVAYAFKWLVKLKWDSLKVKSQLKESISKLRNLDEGEDLAVQFEVLSQSFSALPLLRQSWQDFTQCLVFEEHLDKKGHKKITVKSLCEPMDFFNEEKLVRPAMDLHVYSAVSTHLSSFGILGTFCGLAAGIFLTQGGLSAGNIDQIQNSLAHLLGGAALAFWTSIVGVLCSILFNRSEKGVLSDVHRMINLLNFWLRSKIQTSSYERITHLQLAENSRQGENVEKIVKILQDLHASKDSILKETILNISKEIRLVFSENLKTELSAMESSFVQINEASRKIETVIVGAHKLIDNSVVEFSNKINIGLGSISKTLETELSKSADLLSHNMQSSMSQLSDSVRNSSKQAGENLVAPIERLSSCTMELDEKVRKTLSCWSENLQTENKNRLNIDQFHNKMVALNEHLDEVASKLLSGIEVNSQSQVHANNAVQSVVESVKMMDSMNEKMKFQWEQYCSRFEGVDLDLKQAFQATSESFTIYTQKFKDITNDLDKHMSKGMLTLAGAVGDLNQVVGRIPEAIKDTKSSH